MASMICKDHFDSIMIPFSMKGHFFEDDFFKNSRNHYISAVQQIMSQMHRTKQEVMSEMNTNLSDGAFNIHNDKLVDSYRQLRLKDYSEQSQAATITRNGNVHQIVLDVKGFKAENLTVKVVKEDQLLLEGEQTDQVNGTSRTQKFSRTFRLPGLKSKEVTAVLSSDGVFTVNAPIQIQRAISEVSIPIKICDSASNMNSIIENIATESMNSSSNNEIKTKDIVQDFGTQSSVEEKFIPIDIKGSFLQDNFSHNFRNNFLSSVQDIVKKSNEKPSSNSTEDIFSCYRQLRQKSPKEDNQASSVIEDDSNYKVILDIHEFIEGDIKINVLEDKRLKVEGRIKITEPHSKEMSFQRSFFLQHMGKTEDISAVVTEDGILTIVVPKQVHLKSVTTENKSLENKMSNQSVVMEAKKEQLTSSNQTPFVYPEKFDKDASSMKSLDRHTSKRDINIRPIDSFFKNVDLKKDHFDFLQSVKNVLNQWGVKTSEDEWQSYRNLRSQRSCEENQAVSFNEDIGSHKIVLDVHGFSSDEIKINLIGEDQLTVEGNIQKSSESSSSSHCFKRHFFLPKKSCVDDIKSSLSSDGILTIIIPKRVSKCKEINISLEDDSEAQNKVISEEVVKNQCTKAEGKEIEIKHLDDVEKEVKTQETKICEESSPIPQKQESTVEQNVNKQEVVNTEMVNNVSTANAVEIMNNENTLSSNNQTNLAISKRNNFLEDSFFSNVKSAYENRVKEILDCFGTSMMDCNWMDKYKTLRLTDMQEDNQAVVITEDEQNHKVVLDVDAFKSGDISVRAITNNEIIVEGRIGGETESGVTKRSFKRCFYLPGQIDMKNVTSAMSSDGVLTIMAPKKQSSVQYIDDKGNATQLQAINSNAGAGQGSTWQQESEQTYKKDGFTSRTTSKSTQSHYSSSTSN